MKNAIVRIESVEIKNLKNIGYGYINFQNTSEKFNASIFGLYGQNGSGKTALIDSLALLRFALTGQSVPKQFADFISVDSASATLKYEFKVINQAEDIIYTAFYEFSIRKDQDDSDHNEEQTNIASEGYKVTIFDEVLSYAYEDKKIDKKLKLLPLLDTRTEEVSVPLTKYRALVGDAKETTINLLVAKKIATLTSRSFVFSRALLNTVRKNCTEKLHLFLYESLIFFGNYELFVINTSNTGPISMNALALAFNLKDGNRMSVGSLMINLNKPSLIPEDTFITVEKIISNMNIVLTQIVPGLTISVMNLGTQLNKNGSIDCRIQLMSQKNSREIPLQYESEGIKKIVSILQLLIVVYNNSSITVAIDELDSGVFEYILGELLRIISEKGKGQLIFTSHNLRALETLDKGFVAFTTTNPQNRYIRMTNVKTTNNLRNFYYRDIILGEQTESVYEPTNNYEIALAFRGAGDTSAS